MEIFCQLPASINGRRLQAATNRPNYLDDIALIDEGAVEFGAANDHGVDSDGYGATAKTFQFEKRSDAHRLIEFRSTPVYGDFDHELVAPPA